MDTICKTLALFLMFVIVMSCTVKSANSQSIPKPSVPEFTLNMVNGSLLIEIQNQPIILNGHELAGIFYDFRYKWHESANWYHPEPDPTQWKRQYIAEIGTTGITQLADSPDKFHILLGDSNSHELDYQIRAINGYQNTNYPVVPPIGIEPGDNPIIVVSTSDWSPTQTITLPTSSISPNPTSSPTQTSPIVTSTPIQSSTKSPTETSFSGIPSPSFLLLTTTVALIVIAVLLAVIIILLLLMKYRKTSNLGM